MNWEKTKQITIAVAVLTFPLGAGAMGWWLAGLSDELKVNTKVIATKLDTNVYYAEERIRTEQRLLIENKTARLEENNNAILNLLLRIEKEQKENFSELRAEIKELKNR
jgi:hypothetical protein